MTATETLPKLLDIEQLADHRGINSGHVRRLIAEWRVPYLKVAATSALTRTKSRPGWTDAKASTRGASPATPPYHGERVSDLDSQPSDGERGAVTEQHRYADHRPYPDPPVRLADLTGPTSAVVELPITIDWGPRRRYHLGADADRRVVYERVLQEAADVEDVARYVIGVVLVEVWPRLFLPRRVCQRWGGTVPGLDPPNLELLERRLEDFRTLGSDG
jgi:hypothetical protein